MLKPCQDAYSIQFSSYADMLTYHQTQEKNSKWAKAKVNSLEVFALDEGSALHSAPSSFAAGVSEDAVNDTVAQLGLAIKIDGEYYPLRDTAFKSLLDRAKIGGTALPKLRREDLANVLNHCLALHSKAETLALIRDEKVTAVHSGDERDYSILPIDALMGTIHTNLNERFPGHVFAGGYSDHTMTTAAWTMPAQKDDLLGTYQKTLDAQGKSTLAAKLMPGIRFATSDAGFASAKVSALLVGMAHPIQIGSMCEVEHRSQSKITDFEAAVNMMFAQFGDAIAKLEKLAAIMLSYPKNTMTAICKKLSLPKKAAMEAIQMFEFSFGDGAATAHDVFFALQEIVFILKSEGTPESKLLFVQECIARALTLNWSQYDTVKAVSY